jgi:hypothetical protein
MRRTQEKTIPLEGRTFTIRKFTPQVGCYWAFKLFGSMAGGVTGGEKAIAEQVQKFILMSRDDFTELQRDCLTHVVEHLEGGLIPVINPQGYFGVADIDSPLAMQLMVHSFMFSISDFFTPELLGSLVSSLQGLGLTVETTSGSTTSSGSPSSAGTGDNMNFGTAPTPSPIG